MYATSQHGMGEIDAAELATIRGGNPASAVALAAAMVSAFGWGVRFGYTVVGPWLAGHD